MNRYIILLAFCLNCFTSFGAELSDEIVELKKSRKSKVKIGSVSDDTIRNDEDKKIEVLKFHTYQYEDDELTYRICVTVELTDNQDDVYFAQLAREQGSVHKDYTGEDSWEFQIAHGDLEKPKLTAYAIQYGFFTDGIFVPIAEEFDDVDRLEEITERATAGRIDMQITKHTYQYEDEDDEIQTSLSNHKSLK